MAVSPEPPTAHPVVTPASPATAVATPTVSGFIDELLSQSNRLRGALGANELWWRDHESWLGEQGYKLRPRYRRGWIPSWAGTKKKYWKCEDGLPNMYSQFLDAVRTSDNTMVGLKKVHSSRAPHEVEISQYFSTGSLSLERQNHCVPILDVLYPPDDDTVLLVMPLLRPFDDPPFNSVGEALDFFRQLFEGLAYIHRHRIAHRDCHSGNIMMDPRPLYPDMFHPIRPDMNRTLTGKAKHFTRTENPVKYYFIDFGISGRYPPGEGTPSAPVHVGGDRTVPEFLTSNNTHNPFPTDVYYVGNLVREEFLQKTRGLEFMKPLVEEMVQADPAKRPTADVVVNIFDRLLKGVSPATMRKRLARRKEVFGLFKDIRHTFQNFRFKMRHLSPMPTPPM